jgi:putative PIN family toxin of toxin-antitoxin system
VTPATLDANVIASGVLGRQRTESTPGLILQAWHRHRFELVISHHLIAEVERTLDKPFFRARINRADADAIMLALRTVARRTLIVAAVSDIATHLEDDLVLATAVSGSVDYLVTGDRQLLKLGSYQGVSIVSPRAFLALLDAADAEQRDSGHDPG